MLKFVALYRMPENTADFDRVYFDEHVPAVLKTPGIQRSELARVTRTLLGEPEYYLMAELYFADLDAFRAASKSPEWLAAGAILQDAGYFGIVTMFTADVATG